MAVSKSFFSPKELRKNPLAADLGLLRVIFFYIGNSIILCTHKNRLNEAILMRTHNIPSCYRKSNFVVVALLFYVHGKHLRSCQDGQLT